MSELLRGWRRRLPRVVLCTLGAALVLGGIGTASNHLLDERDAARFPRPGRLVEVPGGRRHLHCVGTGSPTVVLEAGLGNPAATWALVQPAAARGTRVCAYDRGGYGYSDPLAAPAASAQPAAAGLARSARSATDAEPRVAKRLALELHVLLARGGERGPYVLVGHSFGGLLARVFTARFPADVAGLVLVDSTHEDAHVRLPRQRPPEYLAERLRTARQLAPLGVLRVRPGMAGWDPRADSLRRLPPEARAALTWLTLRPRALEAAAAEADAFAQSAAQARAAGGLGDRPLVVLAAARRHPDLDDLPAADAERYYRIWVEELQPSLARLSTRGTLRALPDSGHSIQLERPDAVVDAIGEVVARVRSGAPSQPTSASAPR
jgi:pimeloyl-ACP methyl ester carboxylesterase